MQDVIVQYQTTPETAEQNRVLVEKVYAELNERDPGGLAYATFRLDDGVTFVHVAHIEGEHNPLRDSKAFAEFQRNIADRCVDGPTPRTAELIGAYGRYPSGRVESPA